MRPRMCLVLLTVAALTGNRGAAALQDDKKSAQLSPSDELKTIQQEYRQLQSRFSRAYQAAKSQEEKQKVLREQRPNPKPLLLRSLQLAESHPDSPAAVDALLWTLQIGNFSPEGTKAENSLVSGFVAKATLSQLTAKLQRLRFFTPKIMSAVSSRAQAALDDPDAPKLLAWVACGGFVEAGDKAREILKEKFTNHDALADVCQILRYQGDKKTAPKELQAILDRSTNLKVQAAACYSLAWRKKEEGVGGLAEAEKLFERVVKEFGEANHSISLQAKGELNEMRGLLAEGKPALAIEGPDLDGQSFRLSEYKGKVVLLDFWGFW